MRGTILGLSVLALAACDGGEVPAPGTEPLRASTPQVAEDEVVLRAEGLIAGAEAFYFAAGESEVRRALANVLGKAESDVGNDECGAGPMVFVTYPGNLTINFQEGRLVGWNLGATNDNVSVEGDVQVAMAAEEARAAEGYEEFTESTLGEEFSVGQKLGGFIENGSVAMLYSGTQCFFR